MRNRFLSSGLWVLSVVACGGYSSTVFAASVVAPQPHRLVLPAGTTIRIRTATPLSTKTTRTGEYFDGWLSQPLVANGVMVAPKGARVHGLVAESNKGGRIHGRAYLKLRLTAVEMRGTMVAVQSGIATRIARGTKKRDAMVIGGAAGAGAAIGGIAAGGVGAALGAVSGAGAGTGYTLVTRGAPAVVPPESPVTFALRAPVRVAIR